MQSTEVNETSTEEEKYPLSEVINVLEGETIYKTGKWWSAVVLGEQYGRRKVFIYLWCKDATGKWKRKQKSTISSAKDFDKIVEAVRRYLPKVLAFIGGASQSPQSPQ